MRFFIKFDSFFSSIRKNIALTVIAIFLLNLVFLIHYKPQGSSSDLKFSEPNEYDFNNRSIDIFRAWSDHYKLNNANPPERSPSLELDSKTLPAPHIQDCVRLTEERRKLEMYDSEGNPPAWTNPSTSEGIKVPWVEGPDEDNLPLTHVAQRDYWLHQHPRDCNAPHVRFLIIPWAESLFHGLGSQLHVMSVALTIAHALGRVLVPMPETFTRAFHDGCLGKNNGSFNCYFFPLTYEECEEEAIRLWEEEDEKKASISLKGLSFPRLLRKSNEKGRVVTLYNLKDFIRFRYLPEATDTWGKPWRNISRFIEDSNSTRDRDFDLERLLWTRSQVTRYMLRWPSLMLCHLVNCERHSAYGQQVARQVAEAERHQRNSVDIPSDFRHLAGSEALASKPSRLQRNAWNNLKPFIFRPIVSMHVRLSDKGREMKLYSFSNYMFLIERIRFRSPDLKYIWLTTEMQSVIDESSKYTDWTFFHSNDPKTNNSLLFYFYEKETGVRQIADASFVNLMISSDSDYFMGTLESNWNRLINELRLTNGRLKSGYLALNYGDW